MLAASFAAAPGFDILGGTLLCCDFSVRRKVKYLLWGRVGANELEIGTV
jgi:hypothetical protein